jgi:hypothetical protein
MRGNRRRTTKSQQTFLTKELRAEHGIGCSSSKIKWSRRYVMRCLMLISGARYFTVFDLKSAFWQIELDAESAKLTAFHTPYGRYIWLRMPFGINSASDVLQRRMHQLIEKLEGVDVVADDFVVYGKGHTDDEARADHDRNLIEFLNRARQHHIVLGKDKAKLRERSTSFIGHVITTEGLAAAPERIKALQDTLSPADVIGVRRFIGFVQYLAKFMPSLAQSSSHSLKLSFLRFKL